MISATDFEGEARKLLLNSHRILTETARTAQRTQIVADEWTEPIPFGPQPRPFPPNLLPGALGEFAESLAVHTETPRELAALMCLAVTSASVAGRCKVEIREGYSEPLNIFVAPALESGNRKTAVVSAARQPLIDFEREEQERLEPQRRAAISERKTLEARIEKLRKQASSGSKDANEQLRACEGSLVEIPGLPRLWTQDVTPEALAFLAFKNNERMAILSDEGGYFDILAGRYSRGVPNLDFVLQAHAGTSVRVDRKSGDAIFMDNPLLTIGMSPQPAVLSGLAEVPGFRGRGLLARFLYALPPSNLGYRAHRQNPIPRGTQLDYTNMIRRLLELPGGSGSCGLQTPIKLTFAPSAYILWDEFVHMVEVEMREGNRLAAFKDWASKLPGAAARIAGIFHSATTDPRTNTQISPGTTELALAVASLLISHAVCACGLMGTSPEAEMAKRIVKWVVERGEEETTQREVFGAFQTSLKKMDCLDPIRKLLIVYNYVREEERHTKGRTSRIWRWNPRLFGGPK